MAIDLDKLREKHTQITQGTPSQDFLSSFFQVQEGTNTVRILPGKDDDTEFYAETKIHRITGDDGRVRNFHCRKMHGQPCPLCDAYFGLWKTDSKDDETTARLIKPRSRFYMNVVDRESSEVKILSVGIMLFQSIIGSMLDPDYGDITDLEEGHDFKIIKKMEGQWPKYDQSGPRPRPQPSGSKAEVAAWMDSLHDIHSLVKVEDYDEVRQVAENILPGVMGGASATERTATSDTTSEEVSDADYMENLQS